jgi:hypothetical protein
MKRWERGGSIVFESTILYLGYSVLYRHEVLMLNF